MKENSFGQPLSTAYYGPFFSARSKQEVLVDEGADVVSRVTVRRMWRTGLAQRTIFLGCAGGLAVEVAEPLRLLI